MTAKIRILLAEDQAMVRGALIALLRMEDDIEVVAEVSQGDQVLPAALKSQPDVALLDIEMPGSDGISAAQVLHKSLPSCRIVILTTFGRSGYLRQAMESGAVGFLLKDAPADQLAVAIPIWPLPPSATEIIRSQDVSAMCCEPRSMAPALRILPHNSTCPRERSAITFPQPFKSLMYATEWRRPNLQSEKAGYNNHKFQLPQLNK